MVDTSLIGRDRERTWLEQLLAGAPAGRGAAAVLLGGAGAGKTALLRAVSARAGMPVLSVCGAEQGGAPAYSGLAELCGALRDRLGELPAGQGRILAGAAGWEDDRAERHEPPAVGAALLGLLGAGAAGAGLVVLVDDADLVDRSSLEALAYAARRLGREGVVMLFAARTDGPAEAALGGLAQLRLDGLHPRLAAALLRAAAPAPVDPAVADELVTAAGGNPLAVTELAAVLTPDQLAGRQPLPRPLPVGDRLREAHAARFRSLPPPVCRAAVVAAASFGNAGVVADALERLGLSTAELEDAESRGVLSLAGGRVEFRPPLASAALYHAASPEERRAAHRALAEANAAAGQDERAAWHLSRAVAEPDEHSAALVEAAARSCRRRGGAAEAATGFEAAARLSADPERRAERLVSAAEAWLVSGRIQVAGAMAEDALAAGLGPEARARAAAVRGGALLLGGPEAEARRYLAEEAGRAAEACPDLAVAMVAVASASALSGGEAAEAVDAARAAAEWARPAGPTAQALADIVGASVAVAGGDPSRRAGLVEAVLADLAGPRRLVVELPVVGTSAALALTWAEDHRHARVVLERMEGMARSARLPAALPAVLVTRALLEHRTSRPMAAEAAAIEALDLAVQTGQWAIVPYAATVLATAEAVLGRAESCRRRCVALLDTPAARVPVVRSGVLAALGMVELGEGRPEEAIRWYEVLAASASSPDRANPGIIMWGADLVEAYLETGNRGRAARAADQLLERAAATGSARATAAAKRVRAMLCPDDQEAEALFADALRHYGGPDWRFGRGRVELARGRRLGASGRRSEAEARLSRALQVFDEMGAQGWAARATEALARLGVRVDAAPEAGAPLSPLERQVAMAAALGGTASGIAGAMFLRETAVGAALDSVAAKLGVGVGGLADRLGQLASGGWEPAATSSATSWAPPPAQPAAGGTGQAILVRLLGDPDIVGLGRSIPCPRGPGGYLVKRLALARRLPVEELVEELWIDAPPGTGRRRLRTVLTRLRRDVGPLVVREGEWLALAPGVVVDAHQFEEICRAAQEAAAAGEAHAGRLATEALAVYGGELLPADRHLPFTDGPRERLRRHYLAMVGSAVADAAARGDTDAAVRLLDAAISTNPYEEALYLRAASLLAEAGSVAQAGAFLRRARGAVAELGLPASAEAELLERRLTGR